MVFVLVPGTRAPETHNFLVGGEDHAFLVIPSKSSTTLEFMLMR